MLSLESQGVYQLQVRACLHTILLLVEKPFISQRRFFLWWLYNRKFQLLNVTFSVRCLGQLLPISVHFDFEILSIKRLFVCHRSVPQRVVLVFKPGQPRASSSKKADILSMFLTSCVPLLLRLLFRKSVIKMNRVQV